MKREGIFYCSAGSRYILSLYLIVKLPHIEILFVRLSFQLCRKLRIYKKANMQIYLLVKKQNKKANAPTLMRIKINYEKKHIFSS